ncbi:hypothetical protein FXF50_00440 [Micromonospora sp. AP08]|uniref:hypothetical protein n=1 Tax=Micromonospora sp. AP08 TaxID=2604467 RepID=UPI0011D513B2|nr:hypothetical protein [Micromonospora sp. AP08]TYB40247.1 hypothetical protein FXF50_00440 [Micromonospora sp. AP08]
MVQDFSTPPPADQSPSANQPVEGGPSLAPAAMRPVREWIVLAAGIAAVIGSFMPWAKVTAPILGSMSLSGTDGTDGWIVVVLGVVVAAYGGLSLRRQNVPVVAPILAGLAALALFGIGVWKIVDLQATEAQMRESMSGGDDPLGIGKAISAVTQVSVGAGLWLLTLAGLVGAAATALILLTRYRAAVS